MSFVFFPTESEKVTSTGHYWPRRTFTEQAGRGKANLLLWKLISDSLCPANKIECNHTFSMWTARGQCTPKKMLQMDILHH